MAINMIFIPPLLAYGGVGLRPLLAYGGYGHTTTARLRRLSTGMSFTMSFKKKYT
ncbi:MAG: hypothetical protein Q7R64_03155 [bacterium]|nr:hypothetical protein [bacterium]